MSKATGSLTRARQRYGWLLRGIFAVVGAAFMIVAFLRTAADRTSTAIVPDWSILAAGGTLALLGLYFAFRAWLALLPEAEAKRLARGFYLAQIGKYVPGAIWQGVGQVGYAAKEGVRWSSAAVAFPLHALTQVAAGGTVGAALVAFPQLPASIRGLSLLGLLCLLPLRRRWTAPLVGWAARRLRRPGVEPRLPMQRSIFLSYLWSLLAQLTGGLALGFLLAGVGGPAWPQIVPLFALAWTLGFLALPFPSGIGVREAVLVAGVGSSAVAADLIAGSVYQRLLLIAAEVLMIIVSRLRHSSDPEGGSPTGAKE